MYSIDKFLRPLTTNERNVQIYGDNGIVQYTIMPYSVVSLFVSNTVIKVNLKSGKSISLPFTTNDIAKAAMSKLRFYLDELRKKAPIHVDKELENYVIVNGGGTGSNNGGGGGTISTTTNTIYNFSHGEISPGDNETYYIGDISDLPPNNISSSATRVLMFVGGHVTQVSILTSISGATGSSEPQSFYIRNFTTGSQSIITENYVNVAPSQINNYFLQEPLNVNSGDAIELLWTTPTFNISPTFVRHSFSVYLGLTGPDGAYYPGPAGSSGTSGTSGTSGYDGDRYLSNFTDTKTIPLTTPVGMTFGIGPNLSYSVNQVIRISSGLSTYMNATVIDYDSITGILTASITSKSGSGTYTNWSVNLFGAAGGGSSGTSGSTSAVISMIGFSGANLVVDRNVTTYVAPLNGIASINRLNQEIKITSGGTIRRMYVYISSNTTTGGVDNTIKVFKNGSASGPSVSFLSNTGWMQDLINTTTVEAGDTLTFEILNNSSTDQSLTVETIICELV